MSTGRRFALILIDGQMPEMDGFAVAVCLLEKRGYQVRVVENGWLAVEAMQQTNFDIVRMDIQRCMGSRPAWPYERERNQQAHALKDDEERCIRAGTLMHRFSDKPALNTKHSTHSVDFSSSEGAQHCCPPFGASCGRFSFG
jgi:hypothetical protein